MGHIEIWKEVIGYEGIYEISSLGRIKSIPRKMIRGCATYVSKEKILKLSPDGRGYLKCGLCNNGTESAKRIHILVCIAFLNHKPDGHKLVVDHINGNKLDNRVENLQIVTNRENLSTCFRKNKDTFSSQYVGVYWDKKAKKWSSKIQINKKGWWLGYFNSEIDASNAYQNKLLKIGQIIQDDEPTTTTED